MEAVYLSSYGVSRYVGFSLGRMTAPYFKPQIVKIRWFVPWHGLHNDFKFQTVTPLSPKLDISVKIINIGKTISTKITLESTDVMILLIVVLLVSLSWSSSVYIFKVHLRV